jgi:hypothetical protein
MVRFPVERKFDPLFSDLRLLLFCLNFAGNFKTISLCLTVRYCH